MFKLTEKLKAWAVKHFGVAADATDEVFRATIGSKLMIGELKHAKLRELVSEKATPAPAPVKKTPTPVAKATPGMTAEEIDAKVNAKVAEQVGAAIKEFAAQSGLSTSPAITPEGVLSKATQARVKGAYESYDSTKKAAFYPQKSGVNGLGTPHALAGQPASFGGLQLDHPSELDKAVSGAYFKWTLAGQTNQQHIPRALRMTDHDKDLIQWALRNSQWTGLIGGNNDQDGSGATKIGRRKLNDLEIKTLLDDSTSGAIEATPIAFDDAIVLLPILFGELFPLVNVVNVARGRRMKGALMQNPTFSASTEGTAITPFNTAAFVSAFDTTIYATAGALELGMDFEEDSPVMFGNQIVNAYGMRALEWLDRVIANGNGTTEPLGIFQTASPVSVNSDNGAAGPLTVSDHEGLLFGLAKQFRNEPGATNVFLGNDTMYRRARGIEVGATDQRRVFGMDHQAYSILDTPYKVQNNLPNGYVAYANMKRYRMYRRLGLQVRIETTGRTLALTNTSIIVVRMRFGGQMETGGAVARIVDAQS